MLFWLRGLPCCMVLLALWLLLSATPGRADGVSVRAIGDIAQQQGVWQAGAKPATLVIGEPDLTPCRLRLALRLAPGARQVLDLVLLPSDAADLRLPALARYALRRDNDGLALSFAPMAYNEEKKGWGGTRAITSLTFWPNEKDAAKFAIAKSSGLPPKSWHERWLQLRVDATETQIAIWLEGRLLAQCARPAAAKGALALLLAAGDQVQDITTEPLAADRFLTIDLHAYANLHAPQPFAQPGLVSQGVPFTFSPDRRGMLDLRGVEWTEWKKNPSSYYENYDAGPTFLDDMRMPMLRIPAADYVAAHVLAVADDDAGRSNVLTLRAGRYGYSGQTVQHDFAVNVPRASARIAGAIETPAGRLFHVRVPMTKAFAQDIESYFDVELTKEVRLARRQPDPARFRLRPLGLPSGVRIAAITFEQSPLQMRVGSSEAGHAFVQPARPTFTVALTNITGDKQSFRISVEATHLDGTKTTAQRNGSVDAGQAASVTIPVPTTKRGYHDLTVTLAGGNGNVLLQRQTSFALLPPDTRQHRATSPFGAWDFYGGHFSPNDPDKLGPLYVKAGLRFGMFGASTEALQKYGIIYGNEPKVNGEKGLAVYEKALERLPGFLPPGLLYHEDGISGRHVTRVPDLFTDRPAYQLTEDEKKRFDDLWNSAIVGAKAMREKYPQAHLRLGNGTLLFKEELYRRGFPAALFDSAGNEAGTFGRLPESQPPDHVANNASLWMDRQLLDAYGYTDKPVTQCYEITYPCTNPGNLTERTQANHMVRHALHSLAWGIPEIKVGLIADVGNSYYCSNWGASGFCRAAPEISVKPSYVAFATMTQVLDGAKCTRDIPLGSPTLYGLEFARPDGTTATVLWTIRGTRPLTLTLAGTGWKLIDDQSNESAVTVRNGAATVTVSPSPVYLVGKGAVTGCTPGTPVYTEQPKHNVAKLSALSTLDEWQVGKERDPELETYSFMTPRRLGNFTFEPVAAFEGQQQVLKVTPQPLPQLKPTLTMPMYAVLRHKTGIPVPGTPTEIGLWVNGNSSWGRIIFEVTDASGQRWISLGAQQGGDLSTWLQDWMPKETLAQYQAPGLSDWNTEDVFGISRINYDGWRYLSFPLPGNYPGEGSPWPANSQWRWDKDGVVRYPLTLTKLVIELPEKTLHLKDYAPAPRPAIYLKDLVASEGPLRTSE